ncbi:DNA-3-methyladenine glycosylase II [Abditibacterium utsteinense]|uniref:DNA-3-methyladenine glycosylase II n=1 Tax=Abditibacterium utsteinense TaxID=1960156 RepID=A0A2S8SW64_9BACT|nr:DNA-3-methyladenine glycosylase [Abditibacterium utsteinense]PQV65041.1 DNA-3-methyladenine glycosylase II [Abditibacterium utsteinense]
MTPLQHLQNADPILAAVIEQIGPLPDPCPIPEAHLSALCRIVVGQQLSVAVARSIWNRVETHFSENLTPDAVLETSEADLRKLGLSAAKARTLHALANHIQAGNLKIGELESLSNEEIAREIVAVKGLGPWSADMFLMFHLCREDVLPVGDLGIREAMKRLYNLETRPIPQKMEEIAAPWRPYRTLASRYLWRALDAPEK